MKNETNTFNPVHSPSCSCDRCIKKLSIYAVLKDTAERAEREKWDFGDLTSENYKKYLF